MVSDRVIRMMLRVPDRRNWWKGHPCHDGCTYMVNPKDHNMKMFMLIIFFTNVSRWAVLYWGIWKTLNVPYSWHREWVHIWLRQCIWWTPRTISSNFNFNILFLDDIWSCSHNLTKTYTQADTTEIYVIYNHCRHILRTYSNLIKTVQIDFITSL